jgi:hypothetical protein
MRMTIQLLEDAGDSRWARGARSRAANAKDLPHFEECSSRHFDGDQIGSERQGSSGGLIDGVCHSRS